MTKKVRLTLTILAISCFFIVAPIALLYGWGYRYNLKDRAFIQTGAIYLRSMPRKAEILFNGEEKTKRTPLMINGLLPEKYSVEVRIQGFHPWQKILEVKPTLVTEAKNILLIPEAPKITALENKSEIEVRDFLLSPDGKRLAFSFYNNLDGSAGIWILNLNQKDEIILVDSRLLNLLASYDSFAPLRWSADSNKLLFSSQGADKKEQLFIADTEELLKNILEPPEEDVSLATSLFSIISGQALPKDTRLIKDLEKMGILNLANIIKDAPSKLLWHGQNPDILLWLTPLASENILFQLDVSDDLKSLKDKAPQKIAKAILDFNTSQSNIYTLKKTTILKDTRYTIYKNNFELAEFPKELGIPKKLFILEERGMVVETDEEKIYLLILRDNNPLLDNNPPFFLLTKGANEIKLSPDKNKILYWQEQELKIYFLQKNISYEREAGDIETINLASPAEKVLWYKDSEHLIYTQDGIIRITEIDQRSERNDVKFTRGEKPIYDPAEDILYFLDKDNLYKAKVATKTIR